MSEPSVPRDLPEAATPAPTRTGRWALVLATVGVLALLMIAAWGLDLGPFAPRAPSGASSDIGGAPPFSLGTFAESTSGSGSAQRWYYNSTVQTTVPGWTWGETNPELLNNEGAINRSGPTTFTATNGAASCNVASLEYSTATWGPPSTDGCAGVPVGADAPIVVGAQIQLESGVSLDHLGDTVRLLFQGGASGSTTIAIP